MNVVFESDRLMFRKFMEADKDLIFQLNNDPEVTRYTNDPVLSTEQAEKILIEIIIPQYKKNNFGRWAVHLKSTTEFIGWCGLKLIEENGETDLGYRFMKKYWNHGYATEAAKATLNYGINKLKINCITGHSLPENVASIKVMKNCGMINMGQTESHGEITETYQITRI